MDQESLSKKLSLSKAASKLQLDDLTQDEATKLLLQFNTNNQLPIFLATTLDGYRTDQPIQQDYDPDGYPCMELIKEDATTVSYSRGSIRLLTGYFEEHQEEPLYISVESFHQNGIDYNSVDNSKFMLYPVTLIEDCFYIVREDLQAFIKAMGEKQPSTLAMDYKEPSNKPSKDDKNLDDINSNKFSVFHAMEGLRYDEITLSFIAGDMIEIEIRGKKIKIGYESLSLKNMTTGKLNGSGQMLLELAQNKHVKTSSKNIKSKQSLKKVINTALNMKGEPFPVIAEPYKYYYKLLNIEDQRNRADERAKEKAERTLFGENIQYQSTESQRLDALGSKILEECDDENSS